MFLIRSSRFGKAHNHDRLSTKVYRLLCHSKNRFLKDMILKNTTVTRDHLTPEMKLRLITPDCEIWHAKYSDPIFPNDPFWGFYWPGGQALSRFLLDNKDVVVGKYVVDIGSGSGACAVAAAISGAQAVVANDIDPLSIAAIDINSKLNNVHIDTFQDNLIGSSIDSLTTKAIDILKKCNVILIGDMFYDTEFSHKLFEWLICKVNEGKEVFVGDPGRSDLKNLENLNTFGKFIKLAEYNFHKIEYNGFPSAAIYRVRNDYLVINQRMFGRPIEMTEPTLPLTTYEAKKTKSLAI